MIDGNAEEPLFAATRTNLLQLIKRNVYSV